MAKSMDGLVGTALLEAIWSSKEQDVLDVITPFVIMGVAKTTNVSKQIDLNQVAEYIEENYGYSDFPKAIVEKVLNRVNRSGAQYFRKKHGSYFLQSSLDQQVEQQESRKIECKERIDRIAESLSEYLKMHCKKSRFYSKETTPDALQRFFSKYGIDVESETIGLKRIDPAKNEEDYYIAQFIIDGKQRGTVEYDYIVSLVRGYFLKTAIYLQPNNGNLCSAHFKDTVFYYDTPFLLRLLGYQSEEERLAAKKLHDMLKKQNGKFAYFQQTYDEIISILTAYQYSLANSKPSFRTLEGLDAKNYKYSDVDRLKSTFDLTLNSEHGVVKENVPPYPTDKEGNVDQSKVLPEEEIKKYILENIRHAYKEESLNADICSVVGIYHLRGCRSYKAIENCKAILVTTNKDFTRIFNDHFKKNIDRDGMPMVISDTDLSAIAWIKGNKSDIEIPQSQLLVNAYIVMQPSEEIVGRFLEIVDQIKDNAEIQPDEALALSADRFVKKEIMKVSFGDANKITYKSTREIIARYKNHLLGPERDKLKNEMQDRDKKRLEDAARKAKALARSRKEVREKKIFAFIKLFFVIIFSVCSGVLINKARAEGFSVGLLPLFIFDCISILGILDVILDLFGAIKKRVQKYGNQYEARIYEQEMDKAREILSVGSSETLEDQESQS